MRKRDLITSAILFSVFTNPIYTTELQWVGGVSGSWSNNGNWELPGHVPPAGPPASGDILIFTQAGGNQNACNNDVAGLTFLNALEVSGDGSLYTFTGNDLGLIDVLINSNTGAQNQKIQFNVPLVAMNPLTVAVLTNSGLEIDGVISGSESLAVNGGGRLFLTANNTYSGPTTVASGTLLEAFPLSLMNTVVNSGTVAYLATGDTTNAAISGSGALAISENITPNSVTMTGACTYTGATTISPGATLKPGVTAFTLSANSDFTLASTATLDITSSSQQIGSLSGSGTVTLGAQTLETGNLNNTSFTGVINGAGGKISKAGTGTFTLTNVNTYTGGTTISNGAISISADDNLGTGNIIFLSTTGVLELSTSVTSAKTITLTSTATGTVQTDSGTSTWSGMISESLGTGTFQKTGAGTLIVTAANSYTGGTLVNGGTLQGNTTSIPGSVSAGITNNAAVIFDQAAPGAYAGPISGTGTLTKQNAGLLSFTAASNYTGATTVNGGIFQAANTNIFSQVSDFTILSGTLNLNNFSQTIKSLSGDGTVTLGSGTLTTGDVANTTYTGVISGSGSLTKAGSGNFTLTGTSTYTGSTTVNAGTLTVNGAIADAILLTVAHGATLKGTGTVAGVGSISGTVQPGNSIGTLTLAGNQTFLPTSTYATEVSAPASSLLIINPGNLTIDGNTTLQVTIDPGSYTPGTVYPIIRTPAGTITGTFTTNIFTPGLVMFNTRYLANELDLIVENFIPFTTIVPNGNGGQVAKCLDAATGHSTGDLANIIMELQFSTNQTIAAALNAMAAPMYTNLALAQQNNTFRVRSSISSHLQHLDQRSCVLLTEGETHSTLWTDVYGDWVNEGGENHKPGFNATTGGALVGYDYTFWKDFFIGASLAYTYSNFDWHQDKGDGHINSYYGTLYMGYHKKWFYTNAMIMGAYNDYEAHRKIKFPGVDRAAKSTPQGSEVAVNADMGLLFQVGKNFDVGPFVMIDYIHLHQKSFHESGAKGLNFRFREKNADILRTEAGLQGSYCFEKEDFIIKPWVKLSYVRESRFQGKHENASFVGQACNMHFTGLYPNRNIVAPAASLTFYFYDDKMSLGAWYEGEFGDDYSDNKAHIQYGYSF